MPTAAEARGLGAAGYLVTLLHRLRTGDGTYINESVQASMVSLLAMVAPGYPIDANSVHLYLYSGSLKISAEYGNYQTVNLHLDWSTGDEHFLFLVKKEGQYIYESGYMSTDKFLAKARAAGNAIQFFFRNRGEPVTPLATAPMHTSLPFTSDKGYQMDLQDV